MHVISCVSFLSFFHFLIGSLSLPMFAPRFLPPMSSVPCFVPSYRCSCLLVFPSLDFSSSCLMWVWTVQHRMLSSCLVLGATCRLAAPLVLLPPLVHGQPAMMGAPFCCPHGRSTSRSPSRKKTEQHQRAVRGPPVICHRLAQ